MVGRGGGIESTNACTFNDLQGRARIEKEGLGSPWNPYCRLKAAFFPMMLQTTLRFASRTAALSRPSNAICALLVLFVGQVLPELELATGNSKGSFRILYLAPG
jgi:hypothetical protein